MRTPLGCFIPVLSPLELTLFTAWDLFLPFSVFITVTKNSLIAVYYCCTGKAALVCLPCWGFALHLREKCSISVSSMASRWLVPRLWFFFLATNPSYINQCLYNKCFSVVCSGRLRNERLIFLTVFPCWKMVQSCSCTSALSSHTPSCPGQWQEEEVTLFVWNPGCCCLHLEQDHCLIFGLAEKWQKKKCLGELSVGRTALW